MTLTELLIAGTIMTMLAAGMGTLVLTVHGANEYCRGQSVAAQHARVALDRIQRAVRTAEASEQFPGCLVVSEAVGTWDFPDTLVVWSPSGAAVDPSGLPRVGELVLFTPDPLVPSSLLEVRAPGDTSVAPAADNAAAWASLVGALRISASSTKTELTDRLRTAAVTGGADDLRAAVRFRVLLGPSAENWAEYRGGTRAWKDLDWPLDYYSTQTGLRRVACLIELQVLADGEDASQTSVPFFGSVALNYELAR
jgi:Tfp pilus assembly protein PilW